MPIIDGPIELLLIAAALVLAVAAWLVRRKQAGLRLVGRRDPIDREALEAAEREVRDMDVRQPLSAEEVEDDDWGPGANPRSDKR